MEFASKIFIDGGDPQETRQADEILKKHGHPGVQGQTTNPTLIAKRLTTSRQSWAVSRQTISEQEALAFYRKTVEKIARVTRGPISIQVLGGSLLTAEEMLHQARDRITWIPNGVIKFPATTEGLKAAEIFCQEGPVNITLAFSQEQAAAVYAATRAHNYDVFVSPFVGRLDDRGESGMDVLVNIVEMYRRFGDGHVKVLTASVRNIKHILYALWLKSDIITIPFTVFKAWADPSSGKAGSGQAPFQLPQPDFFYDAPGLTEIPYRELTLDLDWTEYNLSHDLTTTGIAKFWDDWNVIVAG